MIEKKLFGSANKNSRRGMMMSERNVVFLWIEEIRSVKKS
jgi:hypothetical protein